jgi:tryptophan-rich sensory protein
MKKNYKTLAVSLVIPLFVGAVSFLLSMKGILGYGEFAKPPLSPPAWLFPIAWTVLYLLMGVSSYLVYTRAKDENRLREGLVLYGLSLFLGLLWSPIFFSLKMYFLAFLWLSSLLGIVISTAVSFYRIYKPAGLLLVPYVIWIAFAGYLNIMIAILN